MRKIILSLAVISMLYAHGQDITVSNPQQLMKGTQSEAYYPVLSVDGSKLLYTGDHYQGLKMYSFDDQSSVTISNEEGAGYQPSFSGNQKVFYAVKNNGTSLKNVVEYNINKETTQLLASSEVQLNAIKTIRSRSVSETAKSIKGIKKNESIYVYTNGSNVIVGINGVEKSYSPVPSQAGYIWSSLSPDGTKVLFFAAGEGIVVMDLNGKVLNKLGNYQSPVWYGNDYIVAQNAKDDGHQYSSSQILLIKTDGSIKKELTSPTSMAMYPSTSVEANKVVYNTIDGRIYMINVTIK